MIAAGSTCIECLNGLGPHQGHPHPRKYHFTAPVVVTALGRIATGTSYRGAGEHVREKNDRLRRISTVSKTSGVATKYPWRHWSATVRTWLTPLGGRPPVPRQIMDHVGGPRKTSSLRHRGSSR